MKTYKVKLTTPGEAKEDQLLDGYLADNGTIHQYTRGEAIKKARLFGGGKIELAGEIPDPVAITKVLIVIKGGLVEFIHTNNPDVEISVVDFDVSEVFPEKDELFTYYKTAGDMVLSDPLFDAGLLKMEDLNNSKNTTETFTVENTTYVGNKSHAELEYEQRSEWDYKKSFTQWLETNDDYPFAEVS